MVEIEKMHEDIKRPVMLSGSTYRIKSSLSEPALFITINDIVLNQDTEHEIIQPFEIFLNSKNMDHFMWVVTLTRVLSAIFRKGGDCTFLVDELKEIFDPKGGYWKEGVYIPSLVVEIGGVIERHLKMIGLIDDKKLDEHQQKFVDQKRNEYESKQETLDTYPDGATVCPKCNTKAAILMDGCSTCLSCGDSKCG